MFPRKIGRASRVLVIDDEDAIVFGLTRTLERRGYQVAAAANAAEGLLAAESFVPDLILLDLRLPDAGGLSLVRSLRQGATRPSVVVMTGFASEETAKRALREGALLVIGKPIDMDQFLRLVSEIGVLASARAERRTLPGESERLALKLLNEGSSPSATTFRAEINRVALESGPHLVIGEPGTGRRLTALAIHLSGPRRNGPFVDLPPGIPTAERVNAARRQAVGGTLFGNGPDVLDFFPESFGQAEREDSAGRASPPRLALSLSGPHGSAAALAAGLPTLFPSWVEIPPLRKRLDDAVSLFTLFLAETAAAMGRPAQQVALAGRLLLERHLWPGNFDEMRLVAERALLLYGADPLGTTELSALIGV